MTLRIGTEKESREDIMKIDRQRRPAFTLIEMVVVVAILAVLAALLMPALVSARKRARTVQCSNNQRQLGVGFSAYLTDNNGYYPYTSPECTMIWTGIVVGSVTMNRPYNTNDMPQYGLPYRDSLNLSAECRWNWQVSLDPYLPYTAGSYGQAMRCPANPWRFPATSSSTSYGMNGSMFPMNFRCSSMNTLFQCAIRSPPWPMDRATPNTPYGWNKAVNMSDITYPAQVVLVGEMPICPYGIPNPWGTGGLPGGPVGLTVWMCAATPDPGSVLCDGGGSMWYPTVKEWRLPDCNGFIATWHNLSMNTLFVDGHVEQVSKTKLMDYSVQAQSNLWPTTASVNNTMPGGIFWTDGKGAWNNAMGWYKDQWPGPPYTLPQRKAFP